MACIDLDTDLGESFGIWLLGDDDAMLGIVTGANTACGFHGLRLGRGLRTVAEVCADRAYRPGGRLVSRREPGAALHDTAAIAQPVVAEQLKAAGTEIKAFC